MKMNEKAHGHVKLTVIWRTNEWRVRNEIGNKMAVGMVNIN